LHIYSVIVGCILCLEIIYLSDHKLNYCIHIFIHYKISSNVVLVPPSVIAPDGNMVVTDQGTDQLIINCTATGIPAPNITWRDPNGIKLPNVDINNNRILVQDYMVPQLVTFDGVNFVYQVTRLLEITNTNDSDTGVYTCVADNGVVGVDNNTVAVFVRGVYIVRITTCAFVILFYTC